MRSDDNGETEFHYGLKASAYAVRCSVHRGVQYMYFHASVSVHSLILQCFIQFVIKVSPSTQIIQYM